MKLIKILQLFLFAILSFSALMTYSQTVNSWLTSSDQYFLLAPQPSTDFTAGAETVGSIISIDTASFQKIDGFGYCLTEGSAEVITSLEASVQDVLLNDLFNPKSGLGISVLRVSIGASDLSSYSYSYDDNVSGSDTSLS